jgi:hypothetical protein
LPAGAVRSSVSPWCFLIEFLLKLLEADEGHQRGTECRGRRTEVILGQILEPFGGIVRLSCAAGGTVVVYRVVLFDILKGEVTLHGERFSAD